MAVKLCEENKILERFPDIYNRTMQVSKDLRRMMSIDTNPKDSDEIMKISKFIEDKINYLNRYLDRRGYFDI